MADDIARLIELWERLSLLRPLHIAAFGAAFAFIVAGHVLLRDPTVPITETQTRHLHTVTRGTLYALLVLIVTGVWIVLLGIRANPDYLANPKIATKIGIVALGAVNGGFVHWFVPQLRAGVIPAQLPLRLQLCGATIAAVSIACWSWAALLGTARDWNHFITVTEILVGFVLTFALVELVALREIYRTIVIDRTYNFHVSGRAARLSIRIPDVRPRTERRIDPVRERLEAGTVNQPWLARRSRAKEEQR